MTPAARRGITLSDAKQVLASIAILNLAHTDVIFSRVTAKFNAFFNYLYRNWRRCRLKEINFAIQYWMFRKIHFRYY